MKQIKHHFKVKDHAVSGEMFELRYDSELDMLRTTPQVDPSDLKKYYESDAYISHTDSRHSFFEKIYQRIRKIMINRKLKLIRKAVPNGKELLDFGCGTGDFLKTARQFNWEIKGIELNKKAREIANRKTNNAVYGIEGLNAFPRQSFDVITLWHVLEHLPNVQDQLIRFRELLKPNGRIIVAVPNYKSFDAGYYKSYWAAYDVPRHLWHFSRNSIDELCKKNSLQLINTIPLKLDAYYISLLSEKYKNGWMNFFKSFFIASRSNLKAAKTGEYSSLIYVIKNTENEI